MITKVAKRWGKYEVSRGDYTVVISRVEVGSLDMWVACSVWGPRTKAEPVLTIPEALGDAKRMLDAVSLV